MATAAFGINDAGQITGAYADADGRNHGFLLQRNRFTRLDAPGRPENSAAWGSTTALRSSSQSLEPVWDRWRCDVAAPGSGPVSG
jgi:probable HAF family extracellular repeat protein